MEHPIVQMLIAHKEYAIAGLILLFVILLFTVRKDRSDATTESDNTSNETTDGPELVAHNNEQVSDSSAEASAEEHTPAFAAEQAQAMEFFENNMLSFSHDEANIISERAEHFSQSFFERLQNNDANIVYSFDEPAMQEAFYKAQRDYAITGDEELMRTLLPLLQERAAATERSMTQISIDNALRSAPQLTNAQLDVLTLHFVNTHIPEAGMSSLPELETYISKYIAPFLASKANISDAEQLLASGCAVAMPKKVESSMLSQCLNHYAGLFSRGFTHTELLSYIPNPQNYSGLFIDCLHDNERYQINAINQQALKNFCANNALSQQISQALLHLYSSSTMNSDEARQVLAGSNSQLNEFFSLWNDAEMDHYHISGAGKALAITHLKNNTDVQLELSLLV